MQNYKENLTLPKVMRKNEKKAFKMMISLELIVYLCKE